MKTSHIALVLAALMGSVAVGGIAARPSTKAVDRGLSISLEATVPKNFGDWTELPESNTEVVNPQAQEYLNKLYSQILTRTYVSKDGYRIMLSGAYGDYQRGSLQAHWPEICYPAQGFKVSTMQDGHYVVRDQWDSRMVQIRTILTGQIPDGLLFRISSIDMDSEHAFAMQQRFAADMMAVMKAPIVAVKSCVIAFIGGGPPMR